MSKNQTILAVIAASLGYFIDIYDLWLFSAVRVKSIQGLGFLDPKDIDRLGTFVFQWQMGGFLVGGFIFGVLSDKKGRIATLFGSILLYSLANLASGLLHYNQGPHVIDAYAACRFLAGIGLAGELGAGIALVSELVKTANRGWATTMVASVGVAGAVAVALVAKHFDWYINYFIGGGMGIALLLFRLGVLESGMFKNVADRTDIRRGDFRTLFANKERIWRYLATICIGLPVWYFSALYQTFSPELQKGLQIVNPFSAPDVILWSSVGLTLGDVFFGVLSQLLKSRRKSMLLAYITLLVAVVGIYTLGRDRSFFMLFMVVGGFGAGFWAVFVTTAGETFGTNLRGTVAITAPCLVRGSTILMTMMRDALTGPVGLLGAAQLVGLVVLVLAATALFKLPETYGRDMDYVEA